jgi:ribosomal protein S18 acetylase RimI-like enzyme
MVRVSYLELTDRPTAVPAYEGRERIALERLDIDEYLCLYRKVGAAVRWDQRLRMPRGPLEELLGSERTRTYVLRGAGSDAIGLCEFDRVEFPEIELKNFGVVPECQGRGLGSWLLASALNSEWASRPTRIWLHTDTWDHPAALPLYKWAGLRVMFTRDELPGDL